MNEPYSPNLFLFQSYVGEILKEGKKVIKTGLFEGLEPDTLLNEHKNQHIDEYHQYFLAAMGHHRTRELACTNYEKLIRQALINRDHLPPALITSVLAACAGAGLAGGSTSGSSSLGSASLASAPQGHILCIGNMIKTMLLNTCQPCSELTQGLNYLLEGTRKKYSLLYCAMLEEVYSGLLVRHREPPLKIFLTGYLNMLVDEVEVHIEHDQYKFSSRKMNEETGKLQMAIYQEENGFGKFGRCFSCRKQASHYLKDDWLPICGLGCREKVKALMLECQGAEPFGLMAWLLDNLPSGDEAVMSFLFRQLQFACGKHSFRRQQLTLILKLLIHQLGNKATSKPLIGIVSLVMTKWEELIPTGEATRELREQLEHYFKVYLLEVLAIIEAVPVAKEYLDYVTFLADVLRNDEMLVRMFLQYDSQFFEAPILAKMLNIISQYAKKYESPLEGLTLIVRSLMHRFVSQNIRDDHWHGYGQFLKKRETRKVITAFNKKPLKGIILLQKMFDRVEEAQRPGPIQPKQQPEQELTQQLEVERETEDAEKEKEELVGEYQESQKERLGYQQIQGLKVVEEEEEKIFESDKIINKRIGELMEEHPSSQQIEERELTAEEERVQEGKNKDKGREKEEREQQEKQEPKQGQKESKQGQERARPEQGGEKVDAVEMRRLQSLVSKQSTEQKRNIVLQIKSIPHKSSVVAAPQPDNPSQLQQSGFTPSQISLFIRQNLEIRSWGQADSKLPIPISLLSKAKVGEYFGSDNPLVRKVSMEFLNQFEVEKLELDDVMRIVMNCYSPPKETQQIQRIIGDLTEKLLGKEGFEDDTSLYQYIYLLLMVQTSIHNPQVRENEKLSLENHLSMCRHVKGGVDLARAEADYKRIVNCSLNVQMKYPDETIFHLKYAPSQPLRPELYEQQYGSLTRAILVYLWEYLVIGLVLPGNNLGLFETTVLMGREGLEEEQKGFFEALRKSGSEESEGQLLKMAIEYGNDLIGKPWDTIVSLLYSLDQTSDCSSLLDRLFTNSGQITPPRMRDILQALLQFSSSEFRKDTHYTRELFVLRHINSLIEYNIQRFDVLAPLCWPLLRSYFRDICLHPRKEISMSAVDSLKQLTMKLVKLRMQAVPHEALLDTFLHVFERSSGDMKELIANVLLNLITSDLRGGWDAIYSILNVLDTRDKRLIVKLNSRLIGEVGLERLGNLSRLHAICIKELRVCGDAGATEQLLSQLWQLSAHIDEAGTWLETVRSIKDIFKISLSPDIMNIFIRLANKCIVGVEASQADGPQSLDREVLAEVMDVLLFLLELRGSSKTAPLIASLDSISTLSIDFLFSHLVGSCGLLEIFRMFMVGEQKIAFTIFFKRLVKDILLPGIRNGAHDFQFEYLSYWCVNEFMNHLPVELLNLKDKDKDFEQSLAGLLSGPEMTEGGKQHVLIEFHLSNRENHEKSLIHLVFLEVVEAIYLRLISSVTPKHIELAKKIETTVLESFDCAFRINRLILLRNFLWNNGFLAGRMLPGLLKQEHRSLLVSIRLFPLDRVYHMIKLYLEHFKTTLVSLSKLKELHESGRVEIKSRSNMKQDERKEQGRGLSVYANDAALWVSQSETGVCMALRVLKIELQEFKEQSFLKAEDTSYLTSLFLSILELQNLPSPVRQDLASALLTLYSLVL